MSGIEHPVIKDREFSRGAVISQLPFTLQVIQDDVQSKLKAAALTDPTIKDTELTQAGILGQVIAQEATAAVGLKTNQAVNQQLDDLSLDKITDKEARTHIVQESSKIAAGFAQSQKQMFSSARFGL